MKVQYLSKVSLAIGLVAWIVSSATADVLLVEDAKVRRYVDDGIFLGTLVAVLNIPLSVMRRRRVVISPSTFSTLPRCPPWRVRQQLITIGYE